MNATALRGGAEGRSSRAPTPKQEVRGQPADVAISQRHNDA